MSKRMGGGKESDKGRKELGSSVLFSMREEVEVVENVGEVEKEVAKELEKEVEVEKEKSKYVVVDDVLDFAPKDDLVYPGWLEERGTTKMMLVEGACVFTCIFFLLLIF